jgi:hypothetical protein
VVGAVVGDDLLDGVEVLLGRRVHPQVEALPATQRGGHAQVPRGAVAASRGSGTELTHLLKANFVKEITS